MSIYDEGATYYYSAAGTNTVTQVSASPVTLYNIDVTNIGAVTGYLQVYDNASADIGAGTPDFVIPVPPNVSTTSGTVSYRQRDYGRNGIKLSGGLSYLWANAATGTTAIATNAIVNISYKGTA